jgi:hypothetical protein
MFTVYCMQHSFKNVSLVATSIRTAQFCTSVLKDFKHLFERLLCLVNQPQSHISSSPIRHMPKRIEDQLCTYFLKEWLVYEHSQLVCSVQIGTLLWHHFQANFFVCSQIANPQILGLITQSQIRKFLSCASPQLENLQICND